MPIICEQITIERISRLEQIALVNEQEILAGRSGNAADILFHTELLQAVDNSIVRSLLPIIEEQIRSFLLSQPESLKVNQDISSRQARVFEEHKEIIDALKTRDVQAGLAAMAKHLSPYFARLKVAPPT